MLAIQQRIDHEDWIDDIAHRLTEHGVSSSNTPLAGYTKTAKNGAIINARPAVKLSTLHYRSFLTERLRWYPDGLKRVPKDFDITSPITLAYWHMGDGSAYSKDRLHIQLATNGFVEKDVEWLRDQFADRLGIKAFIAHWREQPVLSLGHHNAARFVEIVRPFVVDSFRYKVPANPWKPPTCRMCGREMPGRTRNARWCSLHGARNKRIEEMAA